MKQGGTGVSHTNLLVGSALALALVSGVNLAGDARNTSSTRSGVLPVASEQQRGDSAPATNRDGRSVVGPVALKKILHDPRYNQSDGLSIYASDYTRMESLTPSMVAALLPVAMGGGT